MTIKDIIWIGAMGIGSGLAGLFVFEVIRRFAAPRAPKDTPVVALKKGA